MSPDEVDAERASVRRWDAVAGGYAADWLTCHHLLKAAADGGVLLDVASTTTGARTTPDEFLDGDSRNVRLDDDDDRDSVDTACHGDGRCCRSAVWEGAFRTALASSIEISLQRGKAGVVTTTLTCIDGGTTSAVYHVQANVVDDGIIDGDGVTSDQRTTETIARTTCLAEKREAMSSSDDRSSSLATATVILGTGNVSIAGERKITTMMGRRCDSCGTYSAALFRSMSIFN
jgi:hypothetical protein